MILLRRGKRRRALSREVWPTPRGNSSWRNVAAAIAGILDDWDDNLSQQRDELLSFCADVAVFMRALKQCVKCLDGEKKTTQRRALHRWVVCMVQGAHLAPHTGGSRSPRGCYSAAMSTGQSLITRLPSRTDTRTVSPSLTPPDNINSASGSWTCF